MSFLTEYEEKESNHNKIFDSLFFGGFIILTFIISLIKSGFNIPYSIGRAIIPALFIAFFFFVSRRFFAAWQLPYIVLAILTVYFIG